MKHLTRTLSLITVSLLVSYSTGVHAQVYHVNTNKSKVHWEGSKPGGSHTGTASITAGTIKFVDNVLAAGKFIIDLTSIVNSDLENETWNKKLVDHLKSEDFFHVEKYPEATFEISKVEMKDDSNYTITGILTIKETAKTISFGAVVNTSGIILNAQSDEIVIDRTQWKVEAMSKSVFSDLKDNYVDDEIKLIVKLTADSK